MTKRQSGLEISMTFQETENREENGETYIKSAFRVKWQWNLEQTQKLAEKVFEHAGNSVYGIVKTPSVLSPTQWGDYSLQPELAAGLVSVEIGAENPDSGSPRAVKVRVHGSSETRAIQWIGLTERCISFSNSFPC